MHYILHYDKLHYVYMRDVHQDHLLFAVQKDQHEVFMDIVNLYNSEPSEVPDDYTMEVLKMTEVSDDVYTLIDTKPLRYPVNNLYYVLAFPMNESAEGSSAGNLPEQESDLTAELMFSGVSGCIIIHSLQNAAGTHSHLAAQDNKLGALQYIPACLQYAPANLHYTSTNLQQTLIALQYPRANLQQTLTALQYTRANLQQTLTALQYTRANLQQTLAALQYT